MMLTIVLICLVGLAFGLLGLVFVVLKDQESDIKRMNSIVASQQRLIGGMADHNLRISKKLSEIEQITNPLGWRAN